VAPKRKKTKLEKMSDKQLLKSIKRDMKKLAQQAKARGNK